MVGPIKTGVSKKADIGNHSKRCKIVCYIELSVVSGFIVTSVDCTSNKTNCMLGYIAKPGYNKISGNLKNFAI